MRTREERQNEIRDIIRCEDVRTQHELVKHLHARGFTCTQATVSRDVADMGLDKQQGSYVLPEDQRLRLMVGEMVTDVRRANNLVVIHSASGSAQAVAAVLDSGDLPDTLGTIAGDDTILVVAPDEHTACAYERRLQRLQSVDRKPAAEESDNQ